MFISTNWKSNYMHLNLSWTQELVTAFELILDKVNFNYVLRTIDSNKGR